MKAKDLIVDAKYRFKVNSQVGYNDYYFTGETGPCPFEEGLLYCFEGCGYNDGFTWFNEEEVSEMFLLDPNPTRKQLNDLRRQVEELQVNKRRKNRYA